MTGSATGPDRSAAVTRSLPGWGVVAGPFYVVFGVVLAVTRPGFDLARHALLLLTLGDLGWLQRGNLALTGLMVLSAAAGIIRAIRNGRGLAGRNLHPDMQRYQTRVRGRSWLQISSAFGFGRARWKAYQLLHNIMNSAVDADIIETNPLARGVASWGAVLLGGRLR